MFFRPIKHIYIYTQIANQIHSLIASSSISPGDTLPPYRELAKQLNVSVQSVGKAISLLSSKGVLVTGRGKKTLVHYK